jgi:hypothetical protein
MAPFTRGRALVIGVGEYRDPRWNVPTATRDAEGVYNTLVDPNLGGYGRGEVELLRNTEATRAGILAALKLLANRCTPDSVALISITSHGAPGDDGRYYLATSDARFTESPTPEIVTDTGLDTATLARALRDIPAGQLLLIVNACSSGKLLEKIDTAALAPDEPVAGAMLPDAAVDELLKESEGRAILTASRPDQLSYFLPEQTYSYFGQALIDGLEGSAANAASGYVGLYDLYEGIFRKVRNTVWRRHGIPQEPVLTVVQNVGPFPVASYPRATGGDERQLGQQLPPDIPPVRVVERDVITASGPGAVAIKAEQGSKVTVDNSKLIDFGGATVMGGVNIGNVAKGDIINVNSPTTIGAPAELPPDPKRDLPILRERVATARNVDEGAREAATDALDLAYTALTRDNAPKARKHVDEALAILRQLDNGYVRSVVRKIESLRDAL